MFYLCNHQSSHAEALTWQVAFRCAVQNMYAQLLPLALPAPPMPGMGGPPPPMGGMGMPPMGGMGMPPMGPGPMPVFGMPPMGSYWVIFAESLDDDMNCSECKQKWDFFGIVDDYSLESIFFMVPGNFWRSEILARVWDLQPVIPYDGIGWGLGWLSMSCWKLVPFV